MTEINASAPSSTTAADNVRKTNEAAASQAAGDTAAQQAQQKSVQPMEPAEVEAAASVQKSAGEHFESFRGDAGEAKGADPSAPGRSATARGAKDADAAKTTEAARKAATEKQIAASAEALAKDSPTAKGLLDKFKAEGGKFIDGGTEGSFKDGQPPEIKVMTMGQDGKPRSDAARQQTIAHELGHFDYARSNPPGVAPPGEQSKGATEAAREANRARDYVVKNTEQELADEAHATHVNAQIRDEVKANTKRDIGVAGVAPGEPVPSKQELIDQIGRLNPSGSPQDTYRSYYGAPFQQFYDKKYGP